MTQQVMKVVTQLSTKTKTYCFLPLNMNCKHDHPRLDVIEHPRVLKRFVAAVQIVDAVADFYFGR